MPGPDASASSLPTVCSRSTFAATATLLVLRVTLGSFFFAAGYNKLVLEQNREAMLITITDAGVWWPDYTAPLIAGSEAVFGALLTMGLFTRLSALVLMTISATALALVSVHEIPGGETPLGWYSWLLYLPEPLYVVMSGVVITQHAAIPSIDFWWRRRSRLARANHKPLHKAATPGHAN